MNKSTNHIYFAPGSTVTLEFNMTKWPFTNPAVRQAISAGVNRTALSVKGETGYEAPATSLSASDLAQPGGVPRAAVQERHQVDEPARDRKVDPDQGRVQEEQGRVTTR